MQTLLAYAFDDVTQQVTVASRLQRLESYYADVWQGRVHRWGHDAGAIGLHIWDLVDSECRWAAWQEADGVQVATAHAPLGFERLTGSVAPEQAAVPLVHALTTNPERVAELTPPFVIGAFHPEAGSAGRLTLFTDAVGLGRLFELHFAGGWVWSNRPAAACLFGGGRVAAAARGWRYAAACGWFMDDSSPYEGVFMVPPSTQIRYDGASHSRLVQRIDTLSLWSSGRRGDPTVPARVEETAAALRAVAISIGRLWPGRPVVDLSGGRDSRLVMAAFLSAEVDLTINTNAAIGGEAELAQRLVSLLPFPVDHRVNRPASPVELARQRPHETLERARQWHRYAEGLRPASYLPSPPPRVLRGDSVAAGGAAGEIAHGHYYPGDLLELQQLAAPARFDAFVARLTQRLVPRAGVAPEGRDEVMQRVLKVLHEARVNGLEDGTVFDYFYLVERLRRWGTTAERPGTLTPLLTPEFVRAAFDLSPEQREDNALHRALTASLMPQWANVPYFKPGPGGAAVQTRARLWDAADRDLVTGLIAAPDGWEEGFDVAAVQRIWRQALARGGTPGDEALIQRVVWRAAFDDHLALLNREDPPVRWTAAPDQLALPSHKVATVARLLARAGNGPSRSPLIRKLATTRLGRILGRTPLGRRIAHRLR
jgi:hypothetical protein